MIENKIDYHQLIADCNNGSARQIDFVNSFCEDHIDFITQNSLKVIEDKTENKEVIFYSFRIKTNRERYIQARISSVRLSDLNNNEASWFIEEADMTSIPTEPDELCRFSTLTTPFYRDVYSFIRDVVSEIKK